jgi:hypothetical protein
MPTATLAPKTMDKSTALRVLSFPTQAGRERLEEALASVARKEGIDAYAHRLRYYGQDWMDADGDWRAKDAARALEVVERRIGRRLADGDRRAFTAAVLDVMHDLV